MAVIPARDEADVIGQAVRSLPPDTVIVADDGSTDHTAAEAEAAGAGVLPVPPLPSGAFGKAHACMTGARVLQSKWILFADADTSYESGFLESAVATAEMDNLCFLSVILKQAPENLPNKILIPYLEAVAFAGAGPNLLPESVFRGQCILVRREAYEFIGGHRASLEFLLEDVKFAELARIHRMKLGVFRTNDLGRSKPRGNWKQLRHAAVRRSQRFSYLGGRAAVTVFAAALLGILWGPVLGLAWISAGTPAVVAVAALPVAVLLPWYGSPLRALFAPFALYAMLPILLHALYCVWTPGKIQWKGREV